jgi:hypothetical protein
MTAVATTGIYAFLFSRLGRRECGRGEIRVARMECSNIQRKDHEDCEYGGMRRFSAFHDPAPWRSKGWRVRRTVDKDCSASVRAAVGAIVDGRLIEALRPGYAISAKLGAVAPYARTVE